MKGSIKLSTIGLAFSLTSWAGGVVDVYGTDKEESALIIKQYAKQVESIERILVDQMSPVASRSNENFLFKKMLQREALRERVKKQFGFLFVDFQTVFYPNNKDIYTTIEVVKSNKPERLRFVVPTHYASDKTPKPKHDLINEMMTYQLTSFQLIYSHKLKASNISCPVYHCFAGFDNPDLKPYLAVFNQGVIKEKKLILDTLKEDPDPERRAAAELLVGHFKDPREIIQISTLFVQDKADGVRNNAMRVMAATMQKSKQYDVHLMPIIEMLDSVNVTDRNKALYVLSVAMKSKSNQKTIIQNAGKQLIQLLALKQLNNHDLAYQILKKLSSRDFSESNIPAWQNWLASVTSKITLI